MKDIVIHGKRGYGMSLALTYLALQEYCKLKRRNENGY
jgi:hypothetical protein